VSALLVALHLLWRTQNGIKLVKAKNVGCGQDFYLFSPESSYISKEYSFTNYNPLLRV
jgi:ribosomal protein L27